MKLESENKKVLLQNRMLEIEIIDIEDVGNNEVEHCLWEWATEVEWRRAGGQDIEEQSY